MPPRLIAIDIDGTLLNERGQLLEVNRSAVHSALAAGVQVALVTGRSFHHAQPVAAALSLSVTLIVSNGALIKHGDGETILRRELDRSLARELIIRARKRHEGAALIFDRPGSDQYLYEHIDWHHPNRRAYYERNRVFMSPHTPLEDALTENPIQLAFTGGIEEIRRLADFLRDLAVSAHVTITLTEYADRDFTLLDVIAEGCSKGSTLAAWTEMLGLRPDDVMAVGDNLNDQEMLKFAGRPIVMGNAVPELKSFGWPLTGTHDEGGLADAIRAVLPRRHNAAS